jgi:hypothetical protein
LGRQSGLRGGKGKHCSGTNRQLQIYAATSRGRFRKEITEAAPRRYTAP